MFFTGWCGIKELKRVDLRLDYSLRSKIILGYILEDLERNKVSESSEFIIYDIFILNNKILCIFASEIINMRYMPTSNAYLYYILPEFHLSSKFSKENIKKEHLGDYSYNKYYRCVIGLKDFAIKKLIGIGYSIPLKYKKTKEIKMENKNKEERTKSFIYKLIHVNSMFFMGFIFCVLYFFIFILFL